MPRIVSLEPLTHGGVTLATISAAERYGVRAWVSERAGGVSVGPYDSLNLATHVGDDDARVGENRHRLARAIGVHDDDVVYVRQVHGVDVVHSRDVEVNSAADVVVGDGDDVVAILVADCLPVLLINTLTGRFAVAHAGWRGLAAHVVSRAAEELGDPRDLYAFVGPSISVENYQVRADVAQHFTHYPGALRDDGAEHWRLDLREVAHQQLANLGLLEERVELSCEVTDLGRRYFSDRAARPCGRFALLATGRSMAES